VWAELQGWGVHTTRVASALRAACRAYTARMMGTTFMKWTRARTRAVMSTNINA
jgi:hypothetical protein